MKGLRSIRQTARALRLDQWGATFLLFVAIIGGGIYHTYTIKTVVQDNTRAIDDLRATSEKNNEILRAIRQDQRKKDGKIILEQGLE